MSKPTAQAQIARQTMTILEEGAYLHPSAGRISLRDELASACSRSVLHSPDQFQEIFRRRDQLPRDRPSVPIVFEVVNETTLPGARRLIEGKPGVQVLALNFASPRHPGGGFLQGSQAQEESLARASGLVPCIAQHWEIYDINARFPSCLYTDHMIYSPDVRVFRDDEDALLERPYPVSFVTASAVNAGALRGNEEGQIEPVLRARMEKVLSLAVVHGHDLLVLGAWGCGVFANDPDRVAGWFHHHLTGDETFRGAFRKVVFAVLDRTDDQSMIQPFERHFGTAPGKP